MTPERDKPQTDPSPPDQGAGTLTLERPPGLSLTLDDTLTLDLPAADCLEGYRDIRLAVATPRIRLGDVQKNEEEILALIDEARQAGADGVIGLAFAGGKVSESVSEVTAYGTAVILAR